MYRNISNLSLISDFFNSLYKSQFVRLDMKAETTLIAASISVITESFTKMTICIIKN